MPPHNHNSQNSDTFLSDLSLTDSNRFGSASSSLFDPTRDCSSLNGRTIIAVRHLQHQRSSLTSRCSSSRRNRSFDSYDAEHLRRSLHSDEVISTLTPPRPPPRPRRSPNVQSKATKEKIERYKKLYDVTLQDVLSVLKANDDPSSADIILPSDPSAQAIVAACSNKEDSNEEETLVRLTLTEPPAIKRGLDAPPSPPVKKSDDFLSHAHVIIARQQQSSQQRSLSDDDSTVVIDCENESHDIMSLLSDNSKDGRITEEDVFLLSPLAKNKMRRSSAITSNNNFRQPRKEDNAKNKKRRSKSVGGDQRRRQKIPASSATTLKPKKRSNGKKQQRPQSMQRRQQRQGQSSRSKSPFTRSIARGRSATPVTDVGGADIAESRSNKTHPLRHDQSSSTGLQNSTGAFMSLNRSSTDRRRSSSSSREGPRRRPSIAGSSSSNANCCTSAKNGRSDEKKKAKLMTKMKLFALEMKHRLDESKKILSSGGASSRIFKGGDVAEYKVGSSRVCLDDLDYFIGNDGYTKMCAVRILEVGEDAVYEKPLYTILLPNGSKRQTNGNFLSPCCSKQVASESYRSRHQSALKLKSRNRSSSGSSSKRRSRSQSLESNSSRHSHSNRSSRAPSRSSPPKHCARSRSSESNSSRHSNRSISSHRSSSKHYSRRSCSPHKHKSKTRLNDNHHRNGSNDKNDRSTPRSKQHKHPSLPNAKSSNGTSISRSNSSNCPKSPSYKDTDPIIDSTLTLADNMKTSTSIVAENPMNKTQRW